MGKPWREAIGKLPQFWADEFHEVHFKVWKVGNKIKIAVRRRIMGPDDGLAREIVSDFGDWTTYELDGAGVDLKGPLEGVFTGDPGA